MPFSFLLPKTIANYQSQYNGEVRVIKQFGSNKIVAGGLLQSGSIIKQLWEKPLNQIKKKDIHEVLILGFGGGTVAKLISIMFPCAHITGIEIDPVMIEIYEKYFKTKVKVNLIEADCFHWINKCEHKYDLILVDLYQGNDIPEKLYGLSFIKSVNNIINKSGIIIINHLFFGKYQAKVPELVNILDLIFNQIRLVRSLSNIFLIINNN